MLIPHCCNAGLQAVYTVSATAQPHPLCDAHSKLHFAPVSSRVPQRGTKEGAAEHTQSLCGLQVEQFIETVLS